MTKEKSYNEIAEAILIKLRTADFIKSENLIALLQKYGKSDVEFVIKELKVHGVLKEMPMGLFVTNNPINLKFIFQDSDSSSSATYKFHKYTKEIIAAIIVIIIGLIIAYLTHFFGWN